MVFRAYCRIPADNKRRLEGSCPPILQDFMNELRGAKKIWMAFFLFNNPVLFDFLQRLAKQGTEIIVVSLPLRGYDDTRVHIEGQRSKKSKMMFAKNIYSKILGMKNMKLSIFPHMYSWYGALYAGGSASYSFHVKAVLAEFENNRNKCFATSANFATGDPSHSENLIVIEDEPGYVTAFREFFNGLLTRSIPYPKYLKQHNDLLSDFNYLGSYAVENISSTVFSKAIFTCPFYKVDGIGSNQYACRRLIDLLKSAKERILICSQHFHDTMPFDSQRETLIGAILESKRQNKDLEVRLLKQVAHAALSDKRRAAITEFVFKFLLGSPVRINKLAHDKFIIVDDDKLALGSSNYTPTQFAWGENMEMKFKKGKKTYKKPDNFSEVNVFIILENAREIVQQYQRHFEELWSNGEDVVLNL